MGQLGLLVGHLAYVMEQTGATGFLGIESKLRGHDRTEIGGLAGMLQQVLSVARTVFHLADHAYEVGVQAVDAEVDGCALSGLDDFLLDLLAHLAYNLLDAGRMDAPVSHKLVEGKTGDFAAHRVEAREDDGLGGVVDDDFDAGGSLERTDVASLAADDAALDFIAVDMEDGHRVLDGGLRGHTLYGLDDDALGLLVGGHLRLVHDVVDVRGGCGLGLILHRLHELLLCLVGREARDMLEGVLGCALELVELLLAGGNHALLGVELLAARLQLLVLALVVLLHLVELHLALLHLGLDRLHL